MSTTIDTKVLELFNKVKEKQRKIAAASESPRWVTSCTVGFNPDTTQDRINIQTITDLNKIVDIYSFLLNKEATYDKAIADLGIKIVPKWMGYSIDNWKKDIKTRVGQIQLNNEKKELASLESRLDALITIEQRREMELAAIEKELQ